jgi:hypothetical protein
VDPAERFATAEQFRAALEQYLVVSGERIDATTMATVMQGTFHSERAAMHRMIDSRLKDSDFSESMVRALRPVTSDELSEEDPTKVGDLSELVESSRNARLDELVRPGSTTSSDAFGRALRTGTHAKWGAAVALGLLLALIVFAIVREPRAPAPENAGRPPATAEREPAAPSARATPEQALPTAPGRGPSVPSAATGTAVAPAALPLDAVAPSAPVRAEPRSVSSPSRSGRASSARRASASEQPRESAGSEERTAAQNEATDPAGEAPARDRTLSAPSAKGERSAGPPDLGSDLREVPKAERRRLDLEDPFE